ncbi:hypothetical protein [Klebsiella pneumoniae]|uniref:hypothetical protein n=1 Tax=Klebsiella pneumoniae TaxID=573 RepID=UPI002658A31E|nr:hypothetical protein [Klebsiella pneumoniae]HCT2146116.1 hypothetical protein [Raoultella ornithinolytica]
MARKNSFKKAYVGIVLDMALAPLIYTNVNVYRGLLVGESLHLLAAEYDKLRRFP